MPQLVFSRKQMRSLSDLELLFFTRSLTQSIVLISPLDDFARILGLQYSYDLTI
jgi:hypothetical protein